MTNEETTPLAKVLDLTTRMFQDIRGDLSGLNTGLRQVQTDLAALSARVDAGERRARAFEDLLTYAMSGMRVDLMQVNGRLERLEDAARKPA